MMKKHGLFDRQVTLQQPVQVQGANGELVTSWSTVATVWARRLGSKGREFYAGAAELAASDEGFQIRWGTAVAAVDATWRLQYNGDIYNIYSADENGRHQDITILCRAGVNRG